MKISAAVSYDHTNAVKPITVLVVDDHDLVRAGLRHMLNEVDDVTVVGEAENGEDAVVRATDLQPDIVLMDVRMPGMGGMEATRRLQRVSPASRVIAVTACSSDPYPQKLLEAGAAGFITKESGFAEVLQAIRDVHAGKHYVSREIAQEIALKPFLKKGAESSPFALLSDRELEITLMIANCMKVQDVADQLCISPKTVNTYRYRIFEKLKISSDVELTLMAIKHGVLTLDEGT